MNKRQIFIIIIKIIKKLNLYRKILQKNQGGICQKEKKSIEKCFKST